MEIAKTCRMTRKGNSKPEKYLNIARSRTLSSHTSCKLFTIFAMHESKDKSRKKNVRLNSVRNLKETLLPFQNCLKIAGAGIPPLRHCNSALTNAIFQ